MARTNEAAFRTLVKETLTDEDDGPDQGGELTATAELLRQAAKRLRAAARAQGPYDSTPRARWVSKADALEEDAAELESDSYVL